MDGMIVLIVCIVVGIVLIALTIQSFIDTRKRQWRERIESAKKAQRDRILGKNLRKRTDD